MRGNTITSGGMYGAGLSNSPHTARERNNTIESQYAAMKGKREIFLSRAKAMVKLTLPALLNDSEVGYDQGEGYTQHGWQSLGADGHNHLANKLLMTWFPPQRSFFRLSFTDDAKVALFNAGLGESTLAKQLSSAEQRAATEHSVIQGQIAWLSAAEHLIGTGNTMLYAPASDNLIAYPMDRYCVSRSKSGKVLKMILEEAKVVSEFSPAIQAIIKAKRRGTKDHDCVNVYTCMTWESSSSKYVICQEVVGTPIGETYRVTPENNPFIIMVWKRLYGEDYGRGLLEVIKGDLFVYNFLSKALAKGCALMSEVRFLVRRGSATSPNEHAKAETGEYLWGDEKDITVVQLNKYSDFKTVVEVMSIYERRIGRAFLMDSAIRRDAERVTTVELRQDAMELETALGGAYTQIAINGQLPYARLLLRRIKFKLPESDVNPTITTGMDALGKAGEIDKLAQFSELMAIPNGWSEEARGRIKWSDYMDSMAANLNMQTTWLMSEDEYKKLLEQKQAQLQQQELIAAAGKAAPQIMKE